MRIIYVVHIVAGSLVLPVLAVLMTMIYWLWRVRIRRSFRGIVNISAAEPVSAHT